MKKELMVQCLNNLEYGFSPENTALVVVDMQRDFLDPKGMSASMGEDSKNVQPVISNVKSVLAAAREAGLKIIHTREGYSPDLSDVNDLKSTVGDHGPLGRFLICGEEGQDFIHGFEPENDEVVIDKPGFSCFYKTDLEERLRKDGITHLVIVGVTTQCCILSTIYSAVDRGFFCLMIQDSCGAFDPAVHQSALTVMQAEGNLFGSITDTEKFLSSTLTTHKSVASCY